MIKHAFFTFGIVLGFLWHPQGHDAPPYEMQTRELIEILADYDVKHVEQQPFFQPAFGVTNFDSAPPAVWIFNTGDTVNRRSTVIHELLHIHYHQLGLNPPEDFIQSEESRIYFRLFGAP